VWMVTEVPVYTWSAAGREQREVDVCRTHTGAHRGGLCLRSYV
jgi:hypothetical protein